MTKQKSLIALRCAAGLVLIAGFQTYISAGDSVAECTLCSGPTSPNGDSQIISGVTAEACSGIEQLTPFDELNPAGNLYKPTFRLTCSKPGPIDAAAVQCTQLRSGCCIGNDVGWFMCNIDIQGDCSFKSKCASVCCPRGFADSRKTPMPGCSNKSQKLICTASTTP